MGEYERTVEWLYTLEAAKGMDFKLERVAAALRRLGDPHRRFAVLHVAGTNGKGSVAAMLHAVLGAAGYRAGLYTSPHLVELTERIRAGDEEIGRGDVVALAREVGAVAASADIALTFFELLTVMAFVHFARKGVDAAVVEAGLGGRLDATNVVDPVAAVVTTVGRDHTQWLGETTAAIAAEKAGIAKAGRPLVIGPAGDEAAAVLHQVAAERGAPVIAAGRDYAVGESMGGIDFDGLGWSLRGVAVGLRGAYQRTNAGTAVAALAAARRELPVTETAVRRGLGSVVWPGRLEVVGSAPLVILDGAHNPDGAEALAAELPEMLWGRRLHLLFAVMRDKEWWPMVERLGPWCASVVVTEAWPARAARAAEVAEAFRVFCPAAAEPDCRRAWEMVVARARLDDAILVAGSLFLVGAVRALALNAQRASVAARAR